ncbi:hypothetical protein EIP91_012141 [Steccherinum ochraceum]|uniref:Uncharacterized protein n=1 Tax=Steccherinum ochraceum TaxID=92696 RepID=A0A4R0RQX5_9APHY|nr:hypothetical protein EIP91_012141 [Steccherinum ochraceum]
MKPVIQWRHQLPPDTSDSPSQSASTFCKSFADIQLSTPPDVDVSMTSPNGTTANALKPETPEQPTPVEPFVDDGLPHPCVPAAVDAFRALLHQPSPEPAEDFGRERTRTRTITGSKAMAISHILNPAPTTPDTGSSIESMAASAPLEDEPSQIMETEVPEVVKETAAKPKDPRTRAPLASKAKSKPEAKLSDIKKHAKVTDTSVLDTSILPQVSQPRPRWSYSFKKNKPAQTNSNPLPPNQHPLQEMPQQPLLARPPKRPGSPLEKAHPRSHPASTCPVKAFLKSLKPPLAGEAPLFYRVGIRTQVDLDRLSCYEEERNKIGKSLVEDGLGDYYWGVVKVGLKARARTVKMPISEPRREPEVFTDVKNMYSP